MAIRTYRVTPSLWLGEEPMCGATRVFTADVAAALIAAGEKVVLPHDEWATAYEVLRALGVEEEQALERIRYAQTGSFGATA